MTPAEVGLWKVLGELILHNWASALGVAVLIILFAAVKTKAKFTLFQLGGGNGNGNGHAAPPKSTQDAYYGKALMVYESIRDELRELNGKLDNSNLHHAKEHAAIVSKLDADANRGREATRQLAVNAEQLRNVADCLQEVRDELRRIRAK